MTITKLRKSSMDLVNSKSYFLFSTLIGIIGALLAYVFRNSNINSIASQLFLVVILIPFIKILINSLGRKRTFLLMTSLGIFALFIETVGIYTGFPYGEFTYGDSLGFKLFGLTPWTIFFTWSPVVISAFIFCKLLFKKDLYRIIISVLLLVVFDLILDPGAVKLGYWEWINKGFYYTIPLSNYLGWILSGTIGTIITYKFLNNKEINTNIIYILIFNFSFWTSICFIYKLYIPQAIGLGVLFYILFKFKNFKKKQNNVDKLFN